MDMFKVEAKTWKGNSLYHQNPFIVIAKDSEEAHLMALQYLTKEAWDKIEIISVCTMSWSHFLFNREVLKNFLIEQEEMERIM